MGVGKGTIYLMSVSDKSRVKIGYTRGKVEQRLQLLQYTMEEPVSVLCAVMVDAPTKVEKHLHRHFAAQHCGGEWFALSPEAIEGFESLVESIAVTVTPDNILDHIGKRLAKARKGKGWTLRELAQQARVNHAWIARLESGERHNISLEAGARMAVALGITLDYLAGITTTSKSEPVRQGEEEP